MNFFLRESTETSFWSSTSSQDQDWLLDLTSQADESGL